MNMIMGLADTDIKYCPYCGERIGTFKGNGTAVCDNCKNEFGVILMDYEEDEEDE